MTRDFIQIEPSMISADWAEMGKEAKCLEEAGIEILHLDVMDGHFVPNLTMGAQMVRAIKRSVPRMILDVHLMIYRPDDYIEMFVQAGGDEITFHLEATEEVAHTIDYIRTCGKSPGLAIKPETSPTLVIPYLEQLDKVLVMTVEPGFGGQSFMPKMLKKVELLRQIAKERGLTLDIQVDGGIDLKTGKEAILAGANRLVTGTSFFQEKDRKKAANSFNTLKRVGSSKG